MIKVLNIEDTEDVLTALKRPVPPCWKYGNPVVGFTSSPRPLAINTDSIEAAVLILADVTAEKDGQPIALKALLGDQQSKVLARLSRSRAFSYATVLAKS